MSGCGKSTLAQALATSLSMPFADGDDLHPRANVEKMSAGQPLTDADRQPWLELIRTTAEQRIVEQQADPHSAGRAGLVVACSALKRAYRDVLRGATHGASGAHAVDAHLAPAHPDDLPTYFVYIKGEREELRARMAARHGHFMKAEMLDSQLATLESPEGEEGVIVVPLEVETSEQVAIARQGLEKLAGPV